MLTVACLRNASAAYYAGPVADRSTGLRRRVAPAQPGLSTIDGGIGVWLGRGSHAAGLGGQVEPLVLEALLEGRPPRAGRALRSGRPVSVTGYDLCFSAPKSLSVLLALGDEHSAAVVARCHEEAVAAALGYVEDRALAARRTGGGERWLLPVDGAIGAAFLHSSSRTGDPHLHSHVVVPNLVHGRDGRWTVADGRGLFAHGRAAGSLYEAHLRNLLSHRLGWRWHRLHRGQLEVEGVSPELLGLFSRRRAEIAAHLWERSGWSARSGEMGGSTRSSTWRASRVAWAATRPPKDEPVPIWTRRQGWSELARTLAAGQEPVVHADQHPTLPGRLDRHGRVEPSLDERTFAAGIAQSAPSLTRREVVRWWATSAVAGAPVEEIGRSVGHWVADEGIGVGEQTLDRRSVTPSGEALSILGPRPLSPSQQAVWRRAAELVDRHCDRWGRRSLGEPIEKSPGTALARPARQLADQVALRREVDRTLRALGRRPVHERETLGLALGR